MPSATQAKRLSPKKPKRRQRWFFNLPRGQFEQLLLMWRPHLLVREITVGAELNHAPRLVFREIVDRVHALLPLHRGEALGEIGGLVLGVLGNGRVRSRRCAVPNLKKNKAVSKLIQNHIC